MKIAPPLQSSKIVKILIWSQPSGALKSYEYPPRGFLKTFNWMEVINNTNKQLHWQLSMVMSDGDLPLNIDSLLLSYFKLEHIDSIYTNIEFAA